ncbi:NAD(P)H-dependent oxidoreductase [Clostridioides mangenotii]|uniref:FMN-dependent NADH-azoreductase n=1 Tax=Metaclostridioides mangenotii TaxID=1540 RepID=UPI00214A4B81|nr:NAD(P)H-dependent oxidoreductase [Clostridioides mangenotii]MCR1955985.1 NAD(P)H-dependent oxidoreductase [Clostridioides mangenotii]
MKKKLLYISVNSKPENLSTSKTVARKFIDRFLERNPDFILEEIDLYKNYIPKLEYQYYEKRNSLIKEDELTNLSEQDKRDIKRINELCDQFVEARVYVIASPMWSLSFPSQLKAYIDCIVQDGKTITFDQDEKPDGLLNDFDRSLVYVQSSGAKIPWIMKPILNKGLNYVESIMKFIGINKFEELLVDGTGTTEEERQSTIQTAYDKIDEVIDGLKF